MKLTQASLNAVISWQMQLPLTGYQARRQGIDSHSFNLNGLDLSVWNGLFSWIYDLNEGSNATLDLTNLTDNLLGGPTLSYSKVLALMVTATGSIARVEPGASNGINWIGGASDGVDLEPGESFLKACAVGSDGYAVTGSHKTLEIANIGVATGTEPLSVKITILGSTQ